jgi:hypothetical protein
MIKTYPKLEYDMDRIQLHKREKEILGLLKAGQFPAVVEKKDEMPVKKLIYEGLVVCKENEYGSLLVPNLTEKGELYLYDNPKLKDPSIFQDKGFVVSIIAIIISIIALFI